MEEKEGLRGRFIELRKNHGPTQAKFGQKIGVSDVTISKIESGGIKINEKHIKLVCGTLGINETWLKTGEGPMLSEEVPGQEQLLKAFRQLSPDGRKAAIRLIEALLDSELERAFDDGYRAGGVWGLPRESPKQLSLSATRPPETPQESSNILLSSPQDENSPPQSPEPGVHPIHEKKRG
jgi:transcriptional regulator with XRE-family HTH domain